MSTGLMAAKKTKGQATEPAARTIAFRSSGRYAEWVERLAAHNRSTVAGLMDQALAKFAREIGFTEAPPER
jgi:hypothetical protein